MVNTNKEFSLRGEQNTCGIEIRIVWLGEKSDPESANISWGRRAINDRNADANESDKRADEFITTSLLQREFNLLKIQQPIMRAEWEYKQAYCTRFRRLKFDNKCIKQKRKKRTRSRPKRKAAETSNITIAATISKSDKTTANNKYLNKEELLQKINL